MFCEFHLKKKTKMDTEKFFAFPGLFLMPCEEASLELQQPPCDHEVTILEMNSSMLRMVEQKDGKN